MGSFIMLGNGIGLEGARALGEMLEENKTLRVLELSRENNTHSTTEFQREKTYQTLEKTDNNISRAVRELCEGLEENTTLTALDVSSIQKKMKRTKVCKNSLIIPI
jgi:Ran GTPase-activating protein (RanGAP) involved in mRNA processing and transport